MINNSRSMNGDLHEGITDGMVKKDNQNVGGDLKDLASYDNIMHHLSQEYGYCTCPSCESYKRYTELNY